MKLRPATATDFYKIGHRKQYPEDTQMVYSNFTARSNNHVRKGGFFQDKIVVNFGLQYVIKEYLIKQWDENFFQRPRQEVLNEYSRTITHTLGAEHADAQHLGRLHDLGYLPIEIKALPEGAKVPIGVPLFTIKNTHPDFFWLTNFLETPLSAMLWKPITSATMAYEYKKWLNKYAEETGGSIEFIDFQGHDFSFRGMSNIQDAALSGAGHLLSFKGTDIIPAIELLEDYYYADVQKDLVGASVPATEHSVMCMGGKEGEIETFRKLITETYPEGIVSIVSDTWDFWQVVTEFTRELAQDIIKRNGKVVIRPDSGDPVKIVAGDPDAVPGSPEHKGAVQCLYDVFGGQINAKGFKQLDPHIGLIYGDSITLERARSILVGLRDKGFASDNVVFGIGSFTYQYTTRDSHGFAIKSTAGLRGGGLVEIFKDPATDDGVKKSLKGLLRVEMADDQYVVFDQQNQLQEASGALEPVFLNGMLLRHDNLSGIRERLHGN